LTVRRWAPKRTERRVYVIRGITPGLRFGVHNSCVDNLLRGIRERVYAVEDGGRLVAPPRPGPGVFEQEL
jgi:hypothetical protein